MLKPPNLPWPIRLTALVVAAGLSLYVVELYVSGARFVAVVGALATSATASPAAALPPRKSEPGVVPVMILSESKKAP